MLQRKPVNRLGHNGIIEIKEHIWLKHYPWKDLYNKKIESPFIPKNQENFDKKYCQGPDKIGNQTLERYQNFYKKDALENVFMNYSFDNVISLHNYNYNSTKVKLPSNNNNLKSPSSNINVTTNNSIAMSFHSTKKNVNNIPTNYGSTSFSKNSINSLLKNKKIIPENLYLNNLNNSNNPNNNNNPNISINNPNTSKMAQSAANNISAYKNTPQQNKINTNNLNLLKTKNKINFSATNLSGNQIKSRSYKISNEKSNEKLPLIDNNKSTSKHISSHSMVNKNFFNSPISPMKNHPIKNINKYSSISNNSTGSSSNMSMNFLHRRSGSTNSPNNY